MELESNKIEELTKAIEEAKASGDFDTLYVKSDKLADVLMAYGSSSMELLDFQSAYNYFSLANKMLTELYETLKTKEITKKDLNELKMSIGLSQGFIYFSLGQIQNLNRNPGNAIENFKEAKNIFDLLCEKIDDPKEVKFMEFMSSYSSVLEFSSDACENVFRRNFSSAKAKFQRAMILVEDIINNPSDPELIENLGYRLSSEHKNLEVGYLFSDYSDQFSRGNFSIALDQCNKLCDISQDLIDTAPDDISDPLKNLNIGIYHEFLGYKYLAEGELFRKNKRWSDAIENYKKSKKEWDKGAYSYLRSGLPQALAKQELLINQSTQVLDFYIPLCEKDKQIHEFKGLEQSVENATKPLNINVDVTNHQEVELTLKQHFEFVQSIENNVRQNIEDLVNHLDSVDMDKSKKENIKNKANEVLRSKEDSISFLKKAKEFTKHVREITENLGEIAKPILPFVGPLLLLL